MTEIEWAPGQRVEWRNGQTDVSTGTLLNLDDGFCGPWWLVDVDGGKTLLVKTWALYLPGGVRRESLVDIVYRELSDALHARNLWPEHARADAELVVDALIKAGVVS